MGEVVFHDRMWILGGYTPARINDVWCSPDGRSWQLVTASASWPPRNLPCAVVHRDRIWLYGGFSPQNTAYADVWSSADGLSWDLVLPKAPWGARGAASAVVHGDRLWIMGGFDLQGFRHFGDLWCSEDGEHWEQVSACAPWGARAMQGSVAFAGRIWVIGGGEYNTARELNTVRDHGDVWCSADGERWECATPSAEWEPRRFHPCASWRERLWILGGYHLGNRNDVWCSEDGVHWSSGSSSAQRSGDPPPSSPPAPGRAPWPPRHEPGVLVFGDTLYLFGGYGERLYNDVWVAS